jgi:hypothetical protein
MSTQERRFRDRLPEKIPAFTKGLVTYIPVDEFLRLRFQRRWLCSDAEEGQLLDAANVIREFGDEGETYILGDDVKFSADPRVIIARQIVPNISLSEYLAVRYNVLNAAIVSRIGQRSEYELLGNAEVERVNERVMNLQVELNVTNKVIAAAKINLSSPV